MDLGSSSQLTHSFIVIKPRLLANLLSPSHICLQVAPWIPIPMLSPRPLGLLTPTLERKVQHFSLHVVTVKKHTFLGKPAREK